jgi:hypothetical protein
MDLQKPHQQLQSRRAQLDAFLRLSGRELPEDWRDQYAILVPLGWDVPEDWLALGPYAWRSLLQRHPELISKMPPKIKRNGADWSLLLVRQPALAEQLPDWELHVDVWGWDALLRQQPQFAEKVPRKLWKHMPDWDSLLQDQPRLAKYKPKGVV